MLEKLNLTTDFVTKRRTLLHLWTINRSLCLNDIHSQTFRLA